MTIDSFLETWPGIFLFDLMRYLIPASLFFLLFWVVGRKWWQHLFIQENFPKRIQLWKEFAYSMSTVLIFSLVGFGLFTAEHAGITLIYHSIEENGILYMVFSGLAMIVFHDFYFYWTHRLMHHKMFFRHVHRVHHESTSPSPWAAYSFHPWEALIQAMVLPIGVFVLPLHPLTIFIFLTYMIIRNVMGHLGYEILPKGFTRNKWLSWNTAITHHSMHHQYFNCNYGLYFSWWDRLLKTEHSKYHETFDAVKSRPKVCELKQNHKGSAIVSILIVLGSFNLFAQSVEGRWMTYNEETGSPLSVIAIERVGESIEGKVERIYLEAFQGKDPICSRCSGDRKDQKVIGMNFLWGFRVDGRKWSTGKILDPQNGQTYNSKIWLDNENTLMVRAYGGFLDLFYRTQTWKRETPSHSEGLTGVWLTVDDVSGKVRSRVEIMESNGELRGYVRDIFLLPHEGLDPICIACEGESKNTKIVGMKILQGFSQNGERWESGRILDPGNGNTYASSLWLIDSDTLNVRGYLGPFYRSQVWKRIKTERVKLN